MLIRTEARSRRERKEERRGKQRELRWPDRWLRLEDADAMPCMFRVESSAKIQSCLAIATRPPFPQGKEPCTRSNPCLRTLH